MAPRAGGRTARAGRGGATTRGARGGARARGGAASATNPESEEQENATAENSEPQLAIQPAAVMEIDTPSPIDTVAPLPSASSTRGTSTRAGKFRPKGVRRSEAEREKIVQEQDAILNKRLADDARQRARANRMRGRGAGRGGTRGRGGLISAMAAGPFSQGGGFGSTSGGYGVATSYRNTPDGRGMGGGGGGRGDSKVKGGQAGDNDYATSYQEFDSRINADLPYSRSDYDGNNENSRSVPMGIPRVEHKEEGIVMATAAEIEAREHGAAADDESESGDEMWLGADLDKSKSEPLKDEEVWEHAAPTAGGPVRVKTADGTIIETMDIDEIAAGEVLKEIKPESKSDVKAARKQRKRTIPLDPEDEYLASVLERNLKVFGPQDDEAQAKGEPHPREGKVFLFQLPPILPPLVAKRTEPPVDLVKDEPTDDVVMLDVPHGDPARVDLTADDNKDKDTKDVKDRKEMDDNEENTAQGRLQAGRAWPAEGGILGKLVVRKSGKVTMDWGGLPMAVEAAIPVSFIRTAVLIHHNDTKPEGEEPQQFQGTAYGMGRIEEKFCCAPIFSEPEPWVIDPEELKAPGED